MVKLSDVKSLIAEALAEERLAQAQAKNAEQEASEKKAQAQQTAVVADPTGPLYGNRDRKQEFDLRKMKGLKELPTDKVIVALPKFITDSNGKRLGYDLPNTQIQYFDPQAHAERSKTDESTGATVYQLLSLEPIVLHVPA